MRWSAVRFCREQGQYVNGVRQYFYYVNHEGQLFLNDARMKNFTSCFKDVKFLNFFYARLKTNDGQYKEEFPYVSLCGPEENFVKCNDRPIVFTKVDAKQNQLQIGNCSRKFEFQPEKLCMFKNGRLYHPAKLDNYGLVRSRIADDLYKFFEFDSKGDPTHFTWQDKRVKLTNELLKFDK